MFEEIFNLNINESKNNLVAPDQVNYVVVVAREWLSLIAVIYFHTSMFLVERRLQIVQPGANKMSKQHERSCLNLLVSVMTMSPWSIFFIPYI